MSQRVLVLLSGFLLLTALVSYVYYRRAVAQTPVDLWALVPDDAVLVAATRDHPTLVRQLKETQIWDNLATLSYFQQVEEHLSLADSLSVTRDAALRFLGPKTVLSSVHITGPRSFDLLFIIPVSSVREHRQIRALLESLRRDVRFQVTERNYRGEQLTQVRPRGQDAGITLYKYRNTLVMSANAGLVETVVRRMEQPTQVSIAARFRDTDYLKLKDVNATLLINYRQLPPFLNLFFRPELQPGLAYLASLCDKGLLEMKLSGNRVLFNGFSIPETAKGALHQTLKSQPMQRLRMTDVLTNRTALLIHLAAQPTRLRGPAAAADSAIRPLLDSVAASLDSEAALCYLTSPSARVAPGRLALVRSLSPERTSRVLGQLRRASGTSPSFERYGSYQLYQLNVPNLAGKLLGPLFRAELPAGAAGATAVVGNYLVLADNPADLRTYLTDVAAGEVWSRSPTQVAFLQETTPLARMSLILDTRNSWQALLRSLVEDRRAGLLRNETVFKRFPQVALQFAALDISREAHEDSQYYTQLVLRHPPTGPAIAQATARGSASSVLAFQAGLTGIGPLLMPLTDARRAVVLQDRSHAVHYVTPDNTIGWSDSLGSPLIGPAQLVRSGPGAPAQVLLATANRLYLLDNRGRMAPNFPLNLPDTVQTASVSTAAPAEGLPARLLVADRFANLFLFDAQGNAPLQWQPKRLDFALAAPPQLLRVGGRDVVLALLENGYIFAYDIQGNTLPGFPISLGARLHTAALVETGPTLRRTRLTVVNQHGELVTFTLSGDVQQRRRVATWNRLGTFRLVLDQQQRGYLVLRDDGQGRVTVFEPSGRQLLDRKFVTSAEKTAQLFDFGAGQRVLAITETGPGKAYLYDAQGRLIGNQPFESNAATLDIGFDAKTTSYQLYRVVGNELRRLTLKLN